MEKKELTVEELKAIASGAQIIILRDDYLYATAKTLAEAKMTVADAKRLGIHTLY